MEILIFKTNINQKIDVDRIKPLLNQHNNIRSWNVDIEDVDKVLRVEAKADISADIENLIKKAGYQCGGLE